MSSVKQGKTHHLQNRTGKWERNKKWDHWTLFFFLRKKPEDERFLYKANYYHNSLTSSSSKVCMK